MFSSTQLEKSIFTYLKSRETYNERISQIVHFIVNDDVISDKDIKVGIEYLKSQQLNNDNSFIDLLIGLLLVQLDDNKASIEYLNKFIEREPDKTISTYVNHFKILVELIELNDITSILSATPSILDVISTKENIIPLLWTLAGKLKEENTEAFQKLLNRAKELYPYERKLHILQGWVYQQRKNSTALELAIIQYRKYIEALRPDINYDYYHFELAELYHFIAVCYLLMSKINLDKVNKYCDLAMHHDAETEAYSIEEDIRKTKSSAALYHKSLLFVQLAQNGATRIIEVDNNNSEVLVHRIKVDIICPN